MAFGARSVGALTLFLVIAPLGAVAWHAGGLSLSAADMAAIRFTIIQAALSALIATLLAIPVARALARRRFPGRALFISLTGAPFLLPVVVAILGLLAIFGRAGLLSDLLVAAGFGRLSIYGLPGILLAHVFLNLPLAVRIILGGWQSIPAERFRLAQSLSFAPADLFRHLERPMLQEIIPGLVATIFAVCLTSFAVILMLGGGPRASTIELAIFQAVRFDFNLGHAAGLGMAQAFIGGMAVLLALRIGRVADFGSGLSLSDNIPAPNGWRRLSDGMALLLVAGFLFLPLAAILLRGLPGIIELPQSIWQAAVRSIMVALAATLLGISAALALALGFARTGRHSLNLAATLPLAMSSLVLGTGLFLLLQNLAPVFHLALPLTALINALMALPFIYRILLPEAQALERDHGRLAASLNIKGMARLRWLILPRLARPVGFSCGLAAALSMGDLGVITLFADSDNPTLPLVIERLSGAYRNTAADGAALVLLVLTFGIFWAFDSWGRHAQA